MSRPGAYSVRESLRNTTALITGATGYVGSLVLEQLLRVGHIDKAYLLMRPKQGQGHLERLTALLDSPVFCLHDISEIIHKIEIINGDLSEPGCGMSQADRAKIADNVHYIVHSAASIRFDNPIHTDLTLSYVATQTLANLATKMSKLRCFMYVSTAYSNAHVCHGSMITLKEELYSLPDERGMPLDHAAYVKHLLALDPQAAQQEVAVLQQRLKGALTYGICKNLTEHMIAGYHMRPFPVCINRPVGIGPVAKLPCPGYVGNTAGPTGMMLSIACGIATMQSMDPNMQQMIVPGDMSSSIILASMAAAATEHGFVKSSPLTEQGSRGSSTSSEQSYAVSWPSEHSALQQSAEPGPSITHACGNFHTPQGCSVGYLVQTILDYFREDPSLLHQFGDGQHVVQWTQDLDEYDRWVAAQEAYVQQITAKLMKEKKPRAAARALTAWKVWKIWSDARVFGGGPTTLDDTNVQHKLVPGLADSEKEEVILSFTKEAVGLNWEEYIRLWCAGAKQLFMHEKPKKELVWHASSKPNPKSRL